MVLYSVSTERRHGVSFSDEFAWAAGYEGYICRRCASLRLLIVKILLCPENLSLNSCYTKSNKEWTRFFLIVCVVQYMAWQGFGCSDEFPIRGLFFFFWLFDNKKRFLPALVKTFEEVVKSLSSTGGRFVKGKVR